ncbi:MAG: polysaccharide biosynthesis tyrosine autokinase [Anaerolineales bacterium]
MQSPVIEEQKSESIDLVKYLVLLWHWAWLIALAVVIAAGGAYFVSKLTPPVYQARTTVLVDMTSSNSSNDYGFVLLNSQLTQTYSQMMTKSSVLDEVATRLGLVKVNPKAITANPLTNTQLINIFAESTNPKLAADIANTLVTVFSEQVQSLQTTRYSASEQSLKAQMTDIDNKLKIANNQLSTTTDRAEAVRLETTIANYTQTYASLLQSYEQVRLAETQTLSSIVQIEPAVIPDGPIRPRTLMNVAVAGLVSMLLTSGLIIGVDLVNDTVKTPDEIAKKLGLPVLGIISHYKRNEGVPVTESQPLSPVSEAFRTLRTNVKYAGAGIDKALDSIMIISAMPSEGKTEVLVNLGVVLAQNGLRVLLIDADLRRPALHHRLGLDNLVGLSQTFVHPELGMDYSLQPTRVNGLSAITSGDSPPNPSELLGSQYMGSILNVLKKEYDILLIDTPPALAVTDAAAMLPYVDGVLLVVKPGSTHLAPLRSLVDQFRKSDGKLLGVVLNDINPRSSSYGYYYRQYKSDNHYYNKDDSRNKAIISSNPHKWMNRIGAVKDLFHG